MLYRSKIEKLYCWIDSKVSSSFSIILSLPPEWDYTLVGLTRINSEKVDAIRKAINELENCGYIHHTRDRNEKGHLTGAIYTIYEEPQETPMNTDFSPTLENPTLDNPTLEKPTQLNTKSNKIKKQENTEVINNQSINHGSSPTARIDTERIDSQQEIENYRELIHENIEYDIITSNAPKDKEYVDEIVEIMLECVMSRGYIKIGGQEIAAEIVKSRMLKIDSSHIDYVLLCLQRNTTKVRNIKSYLKTTIYNAPTTINSYFQAEVNHDFRGGGLT